MSYPIGRRELNDIGIETDEEGRPTLEEQLRRNVIGQTAGVLPGPPAAGPPAPGPPGPPPPGPPPPGPPAGPPAPPPGPLNNLPVVWRVPPEVWAETTKYWDHDTLLNAVLAQPLIFHSIRFSVLVGDGRYQRRWENRDNRRAPVERFPLLWAAVNRSLPLWVVQALVDSYRANNLFLSAGWSQRPRRFIAPRDIVGNRLQSTLAIQAFTDIRPDLVRLLLRSGAAATAAGRSIATQMDVIWAQNPERTFTPQRLADFEECVTYVVANGHAPDIILNNPQLMVPVARGILNEAAGRGLVRLFNTCMDEVDQSSDLVGRLLDQYDVTIQRIFDQPQPRPQALAIVQRLYQSLSFLEARYDLSDRITLGHLRGMTPDRHTSTARAAILFGALSHAEAANQITNWLLTQAPLGRDRMESLGNIHPFTYLFHPRKGKRWHQPVARAGYEYDLDMLIASGLMAVQSPIDSHPSPLAQAEGTQPFRMGEDAMAVLYWQNSLRHWSTPLSYALNHWLTIESPNQVLREQSAGLHAAFYLLSRGADPTQVDLEVQIGMANEWNRRQALNNVGPGVNVRPLALPNAAWGMTSLDLCTGPGEAIMNYTNNDWRRVMVPLYFVAHRTNVLPVAGNIMFI